MRPTFRLAAVERLRSNRLGDSARALAEARRELRDAGSYRALLRESLLGCVPDTVALADDVLAAAEHRSLLRDRIALMDGRITELERRAEAARACWLAARAELRAVEALHERFRVQLRAERDRAEQRALDDVATSRHRTGDVLELDEFGGDAA